MPELPRVGTGERLLVLVTNFGGHTVERERVKAGGGSYRYRLILRGTTNNEG